MRRHTNIRWWWVAMALAIALVLPGCGDQKVYTVQEVKELYATDFVNGFAMGMYSVKAASVKSRDDRVFLEDVRLENGSQMIHADRAEILVSSERKTISLRLEGIVHADRDSGGVGESDGFTTPPAKLRIRLAAGQD